MKKILLFLVFTMLISCEGIQYDGEKRLVFQTIVLNANGEVMPNSSVEITVGNDYYSGLISKGRTDQNGKITLVFPAPENDLGINLKIYNNDASYLEKNVFNIHKADFENYKFVYQNSYLLKLEETTTLALAYNQTNFNTTITHVGINGIYTMAQDYYNSSFEDYYYYPSEILIKKNQMFQLKYTVLNTQTNVKTEHIVDLTIGNDTLSYTINY